MIKYDSSNIFAKILRNEIPSVRIFETEHSVAILDAFPLVKGHSLLIAKAPVVNMLDMSSTVASEYLRDLPRLCRAVQEATNADGVTVVMNNNPASDQVVFHAHFHVIPRFDHDRILSYDRSRKPLLQKADFEAIADAIKSKLNPES